MTTERDADGVLHIDGPAARGFVIAENPDGSGKRVEVVYHTLRYMGTQAECEDCLNTLLGLFKAEMNNLWEVARKSHDRHRDLHHKIIWWRIRPEYQPHPETEGLFRLYCRLATTPDLPAEIWDKWETKEGAPNRNVKEVIG